MGTQPSHNPMKRKSGEWERYKDQAVTLIEKEKKMYKMSCDRIKMYLHFNHLL